MVVDNGMKGNIQYSNGALASFLSCLLFFIILVQ